MSDIPSLFTIIEDDCESTSSNSDNSIYSHMYSKSNIASYAFISEVDSTLNKDITLKFITNAISTGTHADVSAFLFYILEDFCTISDDILYVWDSIKLLWTAHSKKSMLELIVGNVTVIYFSQMIDRFSKLLQTCSDPEKRSEVELLLK